MKKNSKLMHRFQYVYLPLILVCFLTISCTFPRSSDVRILENNQMESLKRLQNEDGGFREPSRNMNALYSTYHSLRVLSCLDIKRYNNLILEWYSTLTIEDIVNENNYNNMRNIKHYLLIGDILNYSVDKDIIRQIKAYMMKLQDEEGFFYLSTIHKNENSSSLVDPLILIATCDAGEILSVLDMKIDSKHKLNSFISKILSEQEMSDDFIPILSACSKINVLYELENEKLKSINTKDILTLEAELLNKHFDIDKFFEILYLTDYANEKIEKKNIVTFFKTLLDEDLEISYFADLLEFMEKYNCNNILEEKHKKKYLEKIDYSLDWDGSVNFLSFASTITATFYADKTLEYLDTKFYSPQTKKYVKDQFKTYESCSILEKIFLLNLNEKYQCVSRKEANEMIDKLFEEIKKNPNNHTFDLLYLKELCEAQQKNFDETILQNALTILNGNTDDIFDLYYSYKLSGSQSCEKVVYFDESLYQTEKLNYLPMYYYMALLELKDAGIVNFGEYVYNDIKLSIQKSETDFFINRNLCFSSWYEINCLFASKFYIAT